MPNNWPAMRVFDITSVIDFFLGIWNLVFSFFNKFHIRYGTHTFSLFGLFLALMTLSIVSAVVLNVAKSSARGAEISVSRADQTKEERKKFGRPH